MSGAMASMPTRAAVSARDGDPLVGRGGRYLVGLNGSAAGSAALDWVLARSSVHTRVHLVGVVEDSAARGGRMDGTVVRVRESLVRGEDAAATVRRDVTSEVLTGRVPLAIARAADPRDLVVIGSDKTGYARGRLYGIRAVQLAAVVPGSLAIVPSVDLRLRSGVGVALADLASADHLARVGAREAERRGWALSLVHAAAPAEASAAGGDAILARARAAARSEAPGIDVWARVVHRHAAEAVLNLSRDRALLIVGRSHGSVPFGVGETLHEVILNTNAPTIVLE